MKKILILLIIYIYILNINSYAKYKLNKELNCFEIIVNKDKEPPTFNVNYSTTKWTNQDVVIKVKPSEKIEKIDGFNLENGVFEKVVGSNEENEIEVKDLAGNVGKFNYSVSNIDKAPPVIKGIENSSIYNEEKTYIYHDNESGVESIKKIYYGDLLIDYEKNNDVISIIVLRTPKNIASLKYYRKVDGVENYISSNKMKLDFKFSNSKSEYFVIATDTNGNEYKSNILNNISNNHKNILFKKNEKENELLNNGFYDIEIKDKAGNVCFYTVEIKK